MRNTKILRFLLVALLVFALQSMPPAAYSQDQTRTWTDSKGREVLAALSGFQDKNTVILLLPDGRTISYPVLNLSLEDQAFVKTEYAKQKSGDKNDGDIDWENPKESEDYVIRGVRRGTSPGFVSTTAGWLYRTKCIEVKVQYKGDKDAAPGNIRAYFYNRDGKLIDEFDKPPRQQDEDRKYIETPTSFGKNDMVEVYYPLTEFLEDSDWATVLVTFGAGDEYAIDTMPTTDLKSLAFAEKKYLFPDWEPKQNSGDDPETMASANVDLEIRRIREETHSSSITFDGNYQRGKKCMAAEVRVQGDITPAEGTVKLYAFDASGNLEVTRSRPSTAQVEGTSTYVGRPQIADDKWYPVYFALDGDLKDRSYPTFVLVFQYGGKTAASVESSVGATLDKLEFPEKSKLKQ